MSRNRPPIATERAAHRRAHPDDRAWQNPPPPSRQPVTLTCREGHCWETGANPGSRSRCPDCARLGLDVRVRVPWDGTSPPPGLRGQRHKAERNAARKAEHEARLPLTGAQRDLITRARQDLAELGSQISRARQARDRDRAEELTARHDEVSALLAMLLRTATETAAEDMARLMTARPRSR